MEAGPGHSPAPPSSRPLLLPFSVPTWQPHHVTCACSIFLIDHAWTCRVEHARQQLQQIPGLLHRMANLMGVEFHGELPTAEAVDQVLEEMWKFNQTYQLSHGVSVLPGSRGQGQGRGRTRTWAFTAHVMRAGERPGAQTQPASTPQ